jgi:hypothetical protein
MSTTKSAITVKPAKNALRDHLIISDTWISNGHWAIRRDQVSNAHLLAADAEVHPERYRQRNSASIARAVEVPENANLQTFTGTSECHLQKDGTFGRIFTAETDNSIKAMLSWDYLKQFASAFTSDVQHMTCRMSKPDDRAFFFNAAGEHVFTLMTMRF